MTTPPHRLDLLIVGLGPAGVACALQATRDGLRTLALGDQPVGGLLPAARRIDNLPGRPGTSGVELARQLDAHVAAAGLAVRLAPVVAARRDRDGFVVPTPDGDLHSRALCLACGTVPAPLPPALADLPRGVRVARDLRGVPDRCDGLHAVVIGGGEAALDTALSLADRGATVSLLVRGAAPTAAPHLLREVVARALVLSCGTSILCAAARLSSTGATLFLDDGRIVDADLVVACVGRRPRTDLFAGLGLSPDVIPAALATPVPGLFLAGDLVRRNDRYVATAMGDGQAAAILALRHLEAR